MQAGGAEFDAVVALGGGSMLDTAKAVNLYRTYPADLLEYVNAPIGKGKPVPGPLKPLIALPTTAGTGSETTTVIVMDFLDLHVKTGISHQHIRPTVALVDPLNSLSAPAAVTANTGLDVLTHAAESFTIKPYNMRPKTKDPAARPPYIGSNPISDLWSEKAIEWVGTYLRRAYYNGVDVEAKSHMAMAATFAGIGFGNAGVHIPHALGYPIAGMVKGWVPPGYGTEEPMVPHGLSVALTAAGQLPLHGPHRPRAARPHRRPAGSEHGGAVGDGGGPQAPGRVHRADAGHRRAERSFRDRILGGRHPRPGGGRLEAAAASGGQPAAGDESRPDPHRRAVHEALVGSYLREKERFPMKAPVRNFKLFVAGKWVSEKESMPVIDKFTGETFANVPVASRETTERAIRAAHEAFPAWSRTPAHKRYKILSNVSRLLEERQEEIAAIICREAGKAWKYSVGEVSRSVETYRFSAEEAKRIHGETVPMDASVAGEGRVGYWLRVPLGVVSAITPFNFPLNLVAHKVGPALAVGNTLVLKPASTTPLTAITLAEIVEEAGVPRGSSTSSSGRGERWASG